MKAERPQAIDLFAGAGGLSLGFEQAGFDVVAAVEIDPIHCATHKYNFPYSHEFCIDIAKLDAALLYRKLEISRGTVDVICGGPPCQGFSLIGKRVLDDPRNMLPKQFIRIVSDLQPRYFVFENVPGLLAGRQKQILEEIRTDFEKAGYAIANPIRILDATAAGVPQSRRRLFMLGSRFDQEPLDYPHSCYVANRNNQLLLPNLKHSPTVMAALGDIPNADEFEELLQSDTVNIGRMESKSEYSNLLRFPEKDPENYSYPRLWNRNELTSSLRTKHTAKSARRFRQTPVGSTEPVSRFHKLNPDGYCNTLRSGTASDRGAFTSPRPIHYNYPRCITNREAARLHSYPDWFRFHITKWHGFRQIGNSVPPLMARNIASQIIKALRIVPTKPESTIRLGNKTLLSLNMTEAAKLFSVDPGVIPKRKRGT